MAETRPSAGQTPPKKQQTGTTPDVPFRHGMPENWQDHHFVNARGEAIRYGVVKPQTAESRGTVVLLPGYGAPAEAHDHQIKMYLDRGFTVYCMDWAGQGASHPGAMKTGRLNLQPVPHPFEDHIADLKQFITQIIRPDADRPLLMSGDSAGGHIGLRFLAEHRGVFTHAVLTNPLIDIDAPATPLKWAFKSWARGVNKIGGGKARLPDALDLAGHFAGALWGMRGDIAMHLYKHLSATGDSKHRARYSPGPPSYGWMVHLLDSIATLNRKDTRKALDDIPVQFFTGGSDLIADSGKTRETAQAMPQSRVKRILLGGHHLWHEYAARRRIGIVLDDFLSRTLPPAKTAKTPRKCAAQHSRPTRKAA